MDPIDRQSPRSPSTPGGKAAAFLPRLVVLLVGVVGIGLAWLVGSAVIPRWWAQRLGDTVDGRLIFGSFFGFALGSVFTILPLAALAIGWRFRRGWKRAMAAVIVAVLLAAPNLATLGIAAGSSNAAHAGERILDVDGPGLRGGSLVGAVIGASVTFGVLFLSGSRRRNKRKAKDLEAQIGNRTPPSQPTAGR
jgi:hypothetical protein